MRESGISSGKQLALLLLLLLPGGALSRGGALLQCCLPHTCVLPTCQYDTWLT